MPRKATSPQRRPWSAQDEKQLKQLARSGVSGFQIAKKLKRTPGAIYQQASTRGIKLLGNRRSRKARTSR